MLGKSELAQRIAGKGGLSNARANQMLNMVFETMAEALATGEEVRITGFGSLRVAETKERIAMNPRTRQPVRVPASRRVAFSPGSTLTSSVRGETRKAA